MRSIHHAFSWNTLAAGLLLTLGLAQSASVSAAVSRGPYLQTGTPESVRIKWKTDVNTSGYVVYGTSPGNLNQTASGSGSGNSHTLSLTGLQPNTRYYYQVYDGAGLVGDSSYTFKTAPLAGSEQPIRVWAIGDSGTANSNARAVRDAYKSLEGGHTDVWLMLGDNAYNDGTDSEYQAAVFNIYPELLRRTVLWPTLGNHDGHSTSSNGTGPYYDIFELPKNGEAGGVPSGTEKYYSFDYGNVHFICLESYQTDRSTSGAMYRWLEADLQANTQPWTVAFWHHPPYTKGSHDSDSESQLVQMRQNFNPLLEDYGVDLVLGGHSHSYERSYLIDGHYGSSGSFSTSSHLLDGGDGSVSGDGAYTKGNGSHQGAVYIVAGASGKTSSMKGRHPIMIRSTPTLGSSVIDVDGDTMRVRYVRSNGSILDDFTISKDPNYVPPPVTRLDFNASADVYVSSAGSRDDGSTVNADGSDGGNELRGLFQWSPGGLPAGAVVSGAKISFDVVNLSTGSYALYLAGAAWTEADAGWADANALGAQVGTLSPGSTGVHSVTLNGAGVQAVRNWVNGIDNNGVVLVSTGTSDGVDISSREAGSGALLEITFEQGSTPGAPAAPSNLSATAGGQNSIALSWTDNADNETGFTLERSSNGGAWTSAASLGADTTGYTDTGLSPDTRYDYRIKAGNSGGSSAYSNVASATTDPAPLSVPAAPGNLSSTVLSDSRIALSWDDNADNETGFELQRREAGGSWSTVAMPALNQTGYDDTGLTAETTYDYRIAATNSAGLSAWSNTVSATTDAAPGSGGQISAILRNGEAGYNGMTDGFTASGDPATVYDTAAVEADGSGSLGRKVAFLRWDLSAIPNDASIDEVAISIEVTSPSTGEYGLYAMTAAWSEDSLSWNSSGGISNAGNTLLGTMAARANGAYTVYLNQAGLAQVQAWVENSAGNHGFVLYDHGTSDGLDFRSSEYGTVSARPALTVSYTTDGATTPTTPTTPVSDDSCPGIDLGDVSGAAVPATLSDSIQRDTDDADYFSVTAAESGTLTLTQTPGNRRWVSFSVGTACGSDDVFARVNSRNTKTATVNVTAGQTIYFWMDTTGYSNTKLRAYDVSFRFAR